MIKMRLRKIIYIIIGYKYTMVKKETLNSLINLLLAILVIVLIFIILFAYSDIWPPVVVVESGSMQHGNQWQYGVINTGDIVIVQKVSKISNIITYLQGRETGYQTYGDYGNVIIYTAPDGESIIHRAMFYVTWNKTTPEIIGENNAKNFLIVYGDDVIIKDVGYSHRNLLVDLTSYVRHSGFITMGDHNLALAPSSTFLGYQVYEAADENVGISSSLVTMNMIEGMAKCWLPWFGDIKLIASGNTMIPSYSILFLIISLIIIFSIPIIYDFTEAYIQKLRELKK